MRFQAPARAEIDPGVWQRPPLAEIVTRYPWIAAADWPTLTALNDLLAERRHAITGQSLRFVAQTPGLLRDGMHYEQRSFDHGAISTRTENWHDLLNALIWIRHTALKSALNARYVAELRSGGAKERSRAQMAITHFDEGGAIVLLRDPALADYWDRHDWHGLFWKHRDAWADGRIRVVVFGHAMLEHALLPHQLVTAKCLLILASSIDADTRDDVPALDVLSHRIASAQCLNDPQELRPLPLSGIPGWHDESRQEEFYRSADCFRPLRPGRVYPPPMLI